HSGHRAPCDPLIPQAPIRPHCPQGCQALGVPVLVTEQRPEALGPTVAELGVQDVTPHPKTAFSGVPVLEAELSARPRLSAVILCGLEAQGCILVRGGGQWGNGVMGAMGPPSLWGSPMERAVALRRLQSSGAFLGTSESLLLELLRDSAHPCFRQVLPRPYSQHHPLFKRNHSALPLMQMKPIRHHPLCK
uniref:Isochorismatase domain containing 2 n=1 Tax=Amazona collaria TaxID=241587 RepID=A0A8B9F5K0_9PSIT